VCEEREDRDRKRFKGAMKLGKTHLKRHFNPHSDTTQTAKFNTVLRLGTERREVECIVRCERDASGNNDQQMDAERGRL
jgi:hypothetical protein